MQIPYLEVTLRQEFNCKWLLWEVVPGDACKAVGRGGSRKKCAPKGSSHCGHLWLSPSGDIWERAENRHPQLLDRAACREIISPECPTCCKAEVWGLVWGPLTAAALGSRSTAWGRQSQWSTDFKTHTLTPLHTHMHPHMHTTAYSHTQPYAHVCAQTHTQMCTQTVTCAYNYLHTHGNSHMHAHNCTSAHTATHILTLSHSLIHTTLMEARPCRL